LVKIIDFQNKKKGLNIYHMYGRCWNFHAKKKFSDSLEFMDYLVGKSEVDGQALYYKKYATADEWTPWAYISDKNLH